MESRKHCAYNQTRECFLGLEVEVANLSYPNLGGRIASLELKSGEGLWITPFREILKSEICVPLDLIYLDEECRVLNVIEYFPSIGVPPWSFQVASVLLLPTHSIYSSQTQPGDQLLICVADEMERCMERFNGANEADSAVPIAILLKEKPLESEPCEWMKSEVRATSLPTKQVGTAESKVRAFKAPKSWLERLLSPDPRRATREPVSNLAAYYWTNAAPQAHNVRDISSTGLYLITEERWYPGTLVLMTLQENESKRGDAQRLLSIYSKVVRWGDDGVGLQFVLQDEKTSSRAEKNAVAGTDKRELDLFLQQLRKHQG